MIIPDGHIDTGESQTQALQREVLEERWHLRCTIY
ncbi:MULTISPECIES: NUDIX domain-containing protein [Vibrio]|nr:NUDIX domain-containing protein [Vibrio anguillarum]MBT2925888.1 NUDIX domain-containing protein [Vibrio anguillarum]MBT2928913.1 NUDIX domain-containing protein [Vibrio anguillarum]MBT2933501.1 NUDIX domain-containing protein [Vibrio anguillarum]MBT2937627.1 NUDIX domain-containing protein [Vibrio anguillarum]